MRTSVVQVGCLHVESDAQYRQGGARGVPLLGKGSVAAPVRKVPSMSETTQHRSGQPLRLRGHHVMGKYVSSSSLLETAVGGRWN